MLRLECISLLHDLIVFPLNLMGDFSDANIPWVAVRCVSLDTFALSGVLIYHA